MPRKRARRPGPVIPPESASMRPGHCAPEKELLHYLLATVNKPASMRPGHCAPEKVVGGGRARGLAGASMRPGHCAPEKALERADEVRAQWRLQ